MALVAMSPLEERLRAIMTSLWYPAVLGSALIFWIDNARTAAGTVLAFGLLQIVYFSLVYSESVLFEKEGRPTYDLITFVADLVDMAAIYLGFYFLGLSPLSCDANLACDVEWPWFYLILALAFAEPIGWRWWQGDANPYKNTRYNTGLNILCAIPIVIGVLGGVLHAAHRAPACYELVALVVCWLVTFAYLGVALHRARSRKGRPGAA